MLAEMNEKHIFTIRELTTNQEIAVERLEEQLKSSESRYSRLLVDSDREKQLIQAKLDASTAEMRELSEKFAVLENKNSSILAARETLLREKDLLGIQVQKAEIEAKKQRELAENAEKTRLEMSKQLEESLSRLNLAETLNQQKQGKLIDFSHEKQEFEREIANLTDNLEASKEAIRTLSLQLASSSENSAKLDELKWKASEAEGQYQVAAERADSLDLLLRAAALEKSVLEDSLRIAEENSLILKQNSANLPAENTKLVELQKKLTKEAGRIEAEIGNLREENESLKLTLASEQANMRETATDLEKQENRLRTLTQQCSGLRDQLDREEKARIEAANEAERLRKALEEERNNVERLNALLQDTKGKLTQSEFETSNLLRKNADLTNEMALLEDKFIESSRLPIHPEVIMKPMTPHTPRSLSLPSSEDFGEIGEEPDFPVIVTSKSQTGEVSRAMRTATVQNEVERLFEMADFEGYMREIDGKMVQLVRKLGNVTEVLGLVKGNMRKRRAESEAEDGPGAPQPSIQSHSICLGLQYEGKTWILERTATDFTWKERPIQLDAATIPLLLTEDTIHHLHDLEAQLREKTIQMDESEELHLAKTQEFDKIKQLMADRGFNFEGQSLLAVVKSVLVARRPPAGSRGSSPNPKRLIGTSGEFSDLALGEREAVSPVKMLTLAVPKLEPSNQSSDSMALSEAEASSLFSTIDKLRRENDEMSKHNDDIERQLTLLKQKLREREQSSAEPISGAELSTVLQNLLEVLPLQ
jgi:hypothetical protein